MISNFKFEEVEIQNSFEDETTNIIYFPVTDSKDFPQEIRQKTEDIIDHIIHTHELDISKLRLNARIVTFLDVNGKWSNEISVVISNYDDIWIDEVYSIGRDDSLYKPFRAYVMRRLEEIMFQY